MFMNNMLRRDQIELGYTLELADTFIILRCKDEVVARYLKEGTEIKTILYDADQHMNESRNGIEFARATT